ncbi:pyridoxamine 5'-phosphate oxidase family protein [Ideonella azotifigens]|uniref:General stress protein FMN-binding split barrel domain-containing protein n=2 Tax=Ideonella azotifigens TaxID=513160 RepID=A0ABN1JQ39_9BURK|nr:pyridoxamine 5'-phosphate oxidase family protein [Ideonella azotifigens]MCD2340138.1 pyridoxamine 5'-phosphate oxidase family protein [Ideonella azotifigens]
MTSHSNAPDSDRSTQALRQALDMAFDIRFAMVSIPGARVVPRPMLTQRLDDEDRLWFFAPAASELVRALPGEHRLLLTYADPGAQRYVSVEGGGVVLRDEALARDMWAPMDQAYFHGRPADPALRLLCVRPQRAELWAQDGTRLGQYARLLAAAAGLTQLSPDPLKRHAVILRRD